MNSAKLLPTDPLAPVVPEPLQLAAAPQVGEAHFRSVIETVTDALYLKDLEGRYLLINAAGAAALGRTPQEVIGRRDAELLSPEAAAPVEAADRQLLASEQPGDYEFALETLAGTKRYHSSKYPYYGPDGALAGIIGIGRDVTARQAAEQTAAESEARYRIVAETASDAIITIDMESRILYANASAGQIFGYSQAELLGSSLMKLMPDYLRRVHEAALKRYAETGVRHMHWQAIEIPALHREGHELPIEVSFGEHHENGNRIFTGIMRDISERKRAQAALQQLAQELEVRVEARTAELAKVNAQLRHDALHDKLTGLANRALCLDRLEQAVQRQRRRTERGFAVLYLDSDRFKVVNDSLGHTVGDHLLIAIGQRLQSCVRPGDTVARLGGDEFVVLLDDISHPDEAQRIAERIQQAVRKPFVIEGKLIHTSLSIGVAVGNPEHEQAESILRDADIAMYHAKNAGKARYQLFTQEMREHALSLLALESDLRGATERAELRVHYQPIQALESAAITGFEALVRWEHPRLGTISPASFIPLAEETGYILELDRWVLREACRQLRAWHDLFPAPQALTMNVNLSSRHFSRPDLVDFVRTTLEETALQPEHLRLEVTESVLAERSDVVTQTFQQLKDLGVKLYIDDFGTGYSSLSYLQHFPVDTLKIDRSFVHSMMAAPESAELVRTIISLAQALHLNVVAEGVETEAQRTQLGALGCVYGQGYLFARPLEVSAATTLLRGMTGAVPLMSDNDPIPAPGAL